MARSSQSLGHRQKTKKFPSVKVQGPKSYIEFEKPSWGEIRDAVDEIRVRTKKYLRESIAIERGRIVPRGDEASEVEDTLSDKLWELACNQFVEWNWVGDDEETLPPMPEINMDDLLGDEVEFIFECVQELYKMTNEEREGN